MYINVLTFEAWDKQQDPKEVKEWGCGRIDGPAIAKNAFYKDLPEDTKHMFYTDYYTKLIRQQFVPA